RRDVRVIQCGEEAPFAFESRETLRIASELRRQQFQGDVAPETRIEGPIYVAHAATAQQFLNLIWTNDAAGRQRLMVARDVGGRDGDRWYFDEPRSGVVGRHQGCDLFPQRQIVFTRRVQETVALFARPLERLVIQLADSGVSLRRHGGLARAARGTATPWRGA